MKQSFQITFLLSLFMAIGMRALAYDAYVNGIYYNIYQWRKTATVTSNGNNSYFGNVHIPDSIKYNGNWYSVTEIGANAFNGCGELTWISIPKSVTYIGYNAFSGCDHIDGVEIDDLEAWCNIGFGSDSNPLKYAKHLYQRGKYGLEELYGFIIIPEGVTTIRQFVFEGFANLTSVEIPNSVTIIGSSAFQDCVNLTSIKIPEDAKLQEIDDRAFKSCTQLTSIYIPKSVKLIGFEAFLDCKKLSSVVFHEDCKLTGGQHGYEKGLWV